MYIYKRGQGWFLQTFKRLEFEVYDRSIKYRLICENRPAEKDECAYAEANFEQTAENLSGWDIRDILQDMKNPHVRVYGNVSNMCVYWVEKC